MLLQVKAHMKADDLELSLYEYAALEERYRTLSGQHRELRKLAQAYDEIIRGSSGYVEDAASIEQLRADAGREGLRAYVKPSPELPFEIHPHICHLQESP